MSFRYKLIYPDGDILFGENSHETYEEAEEEALEDIDYAIAGSEVLHLSNPGDYEEYDHGDIEYEIIEE